MTDIMTDIDKATKAQEWLMEHYRQWIPLDACLELVRFMAPKPDVLPCDDCELRDGCTVQPFTMECEVIREECEMIRNECEASK